jgi:hypothetical protein
VPTAMRRTIANGEARTHSPRASDGKKGMS